MHVLIKMKMPHSCSDCIMSNFECDWCILSKSKIPQDCHFEKRMKRCPLIPVQEHGRLGDLDELYASLEKWLIQNRHSMTEATRVWVRGVLEGIVAAPTIIPAEPPREET